MNYTCVGFNADDSASRMMGAFGPGSPYDKTTSLGYSKGVDKASYPIKSKWRNFVLNRFIQYFPTGVTLEAFANDNDTNVDPDNIVRLIPLVSLYAGKPDMLKIAEEAALQLQVNDMIITIVLAACRIVQQFILHGGDMNCEDQLRAVIAELKSPSRVQPQPLDRAVAGHLQKALDCKEMDVDKATAQFGKA